MLSKLSYHKKFKSSLNILNKFLKLNRTLKSKCYWGTRVEVSLNLFLWHLEEFKNNRDPRKPFINATNEAIDILKIRKKSKLLNYNFVNDYKNNKNFESYVKSLFSDIWVNMTDDIYFEQTFNFTKERFKKNGLDAENFFKNKIVVDAGCGSGKFSCTIAKLKAKKVYGFDLGELGISFAKKQQKKKTYAKKISFKVASIMKMPLKSNSIDVVFTNGVVHHTSNYVQCIKEFKRVLKKNGKLFFYVEGSCGLFEIFQEKIRESLNDIPTEFVLSYLKSLGVDSGRLYWLQDSLKAPYEYKTKSEIIKLLSKNGFQVEKQLTRGVSSDNIEKISSGMPYGKIKYGEGQIKFICTKK